MSTLPTHRFNTVKTKTYISLTREQKIRIRTKFSRRVSCDDETTSVALASCAKAEFSLHMFSGVTAVRSALAENKLTHHDAGRVFKAPRVKWRGNDELEKQLYTWICHQHNNRRNKNGGIVKSHADELQNSNNVFEA